MLKPSEIEKVKSSMKTRYPIAFVLVQAFVMFPDSASAQRGDTLKINLPPVQTPPPSNKINKPIFPDELSLPGFRALEIPPVDERLRQAAPDTGSRKSIPVRLFLNKTSTADPLPTVRGLRIIEQIGLSINTPLPASQINSAPVMQSIYGREASPADASLGSQNPYINHEEEPEGILVGIDPYTLKPIYIVAPGTKKKANRIYKDPK